MLKGAYSEKFKTIHQEQLDKLKEERKEFVKQNSDRGKELSKETNRRRKALEERRKEQQNNEEKIRKEVLAKRKQEQQEATQRFQKDALHKKTLVRQEDLKQHDKEPIPVRDGRYVVRGHVVEIIDGKQVPHAATLPKQIAPQQQTVADNWRDEMPEKYDLQKQYHGPTNRGILYAMNDMRNEGKLYSMEPSFDPYGTYAAPGKYGSYGLVGRMGEITENGPVTDTPTASEQEKLRADAIGRSGPKLAFISDESQKDPPEGALPCIMGRESPGGSVTSLDSLDEFPGKGKELCASPNGIMNKGSRDVAKSAGKRKVTFSDSIEFDDGVTGQLVTEEKQSTKVYTMLYARNANSYCKTPPSGSVSNSAQLGVNQKPDKLAGVACVAQTGNKQAGIGPDHSAVDNFGNDPAVTTVIHYDQPKARAVPVGNNRSSEPEKQEEKLPSGQNVRNNEFSLRQQNVGEVRGGLKESTEVVSNQELDDSLEFIRDSLDEKDAEEGSIEMNRQNEEASGKGSSSITWTIGSGELKDSLEIRSQCTSESTKERLTDGAPIWDSHVGERDEGLDGEPLEEIEQESDSKPFGQRKPANTMAGLGRNHFPVTSGYQYYQPTYSSAASAAVTAAPQFYHQSANVYSTLQSPVQGTFHHNFPYPFYTNVGNRLVGMSPIRQEEQELDSPPVQFASQFTGTTDRPEGPDNRQLTDSQRAVVRETVSSQLTAQGHSLNTEGSDITRQQKRGRLLEEPDNETKGSNSSGQKHSPSPSTASTSTSTRSARSLIPRPPAMKKTSRGRVHPGTFYRKQITARPRKGIYNTAVSSRVQSMKNSRVSKNGNNQTEGAAKRQNSASPQSEKSWNERNRPKRPDSGDQDTVDHDGIIEGIKRNMEMMSMRARHTAAEEQHQRIINSLRLDFGDGKRDVSSQQASTAIGVSHREGDVGENHAPKQEAVSRKVHHPRVGSAGSRTGRSPAGGSTRVTTGFEDSFQQGGSHLGRSAGNSMRINHVNDDSYHLPGSRPGRHPSGINGVVTVHDSDSHMVGSHVGRPPGDKTRMDLLNDHAYQLAASRGGRLPGHTAGLEFMANGNHQAGFDLYPSKAVVTDRVSRISQIPPHSLGINQQLLFSGRRQDYPTSTVGHSTSAATTRQEREQSLQASGMKPYERENDDLSKSISLDKTPTDDEINHLWAHVRSYLHGGSTKSVGSDSCVDRVDVRRSRTRSGSTQQAVHQNTIPQHNAPDIQPMREKYLLGVPPQGAGSTLGGLRRYGSHEVLRRDSSSDSLSLKRSPLLQHRASRSRRPQKHAHGQNGRPPLPRQQEYNPAPSQAGPSASVSTRVGSSEPLSPAEMQAVMKASQKETLHKHQDNFTGVSAHQQYQAIMTGRAGPSAISLEEQRLLQSLDRLNERLKAQEEITKAIAQKPRMNDAGVRKRGQAGLGTGQAKNNQHTSNRNLLHTR